jgi:hypothetical protein
MYSDTNVYPLQYHGEQLPNPDSRVTLTQELDRLGRRKLAIDLQFTSQAPAGSSAHTSTGTSTSASLA